MDEFKFGIEYNRMSRHNPIKPTKYIMAYFKYKIDRDCIIDVLRIEYPNSDFNVVDVE